MKTKIIIIEDNYYKYFTMRQLIETQMKIKVDVVTAASSEELEASVEQVNPGLLIIKPRGGVVELMNFFKQRKLNCRNASVTIVVVPENSQRQFANIERAANRKSAQIPVAA